MSFTFLYDVISIFVCQRVEYRLENSLIFPESLKILQSILAWFHSPSLGPIRTAATTSETPESTKQFNNVPQL